MAVLSAPLDTTIEGLNYSDNERNNGGGALVPPDPAGAAGPTHVLNATNASIQWFTKSGITHYHSSLNNFYQPLNPAPFLFDPKVTYDFEANRFVVVTLEVLDSGAGDPVNASRVLVAVSDDSDPNGTWRYQAFNTLQTINGEPQWLDYPGLAVDDKAIYITGNMFPFLSGTAAAGGSRLLIIDKGIGTDGLYDGGLSTMTIHNPAGALAASQGFTLQPAQTFGTTPAFGNTSNRVGTWLTAYNGGIGATNEQMLVIRVDSPLNNPTFDVQTVQLGDIDNATNLGYATTIAPDTLDAPQPGTTTLIDTNDRRALNAVWRNNALWTVFQVIPNTGPDAGQTTVHWVKINTTNPGSLTVADQGNIGAEEVGGTIYTFMPSIAVDAAGNAVIGFAASGPAMYASAMYATRSATDAAGTFRVPRILAQGLDSYERTFGGTDNRWGDYSATVLDPDGASFWVYNEYAIAREVGAGTDDGRWGTRWGKLHIADVPGGGGGGGGGGGSSGVATVTGLKWSDEDSDGVKDPAELGVGGFTFYLDINNNDAIDVGEPAAVSDALGNYTITTTKTGSYAVREAPLSGWTQTYPGQAANYETTVTLVANTTVSGINFGNHGIAYDFGDAPSNYPVTLAKDGARHAVKPGLHLGAPTINVPTNGTVGVEPDTEADGQTDSAALGDDNTGIDDEDGVVIGAQALIAGQNATIQVTVSTGTLPAARVYGWIDFNGDGDWNDAGEAIITNQTKAQGTHNFTFPVPVGATRNPTYARFRYGYEQDLKPTGFSIAGEVEDYQVQVLTDEPLANNDTYIVNQNSINNILNVLANDFASSGQTLSILSFATPTTTPNGGVVQRNDNGTPNNTADDVLVYSPLNGFTGTDTFDYVITDGSGKNDTGTVTVTVRSILNDPIAVDDSIVIAANGSGQVAVTQLNVLTNDINGNAPPIRITSVTQPGAGQGSITIINSGNALRYTPPSGSFVGDIQFTYTISDSTSPTAKTSTGEVTLHVGASTADDVIQIRLQPYDLDGSPISVINPSQEFELRAFVKDLRTDDTVGAPTDNLGVYAAYFDLLYSSTLVSPTQPIVFNGDVDDPFKPWTSGQSAGTTVPGQINEVGAFQGNSPFFSQNFVLLFSQRMRANTTGQAIFSSDPADLAPLHDTLVYQPVTANPIDFTKITYGTGSLFIGNPADVLFEAVDDTLAALATTATTLQVTNNDLFGLSRPVEISAVTQPPSGQGSVVINTGSNTLLYTPPANFAGGTVQFTYTLRNLAGATDTATVTLQVGATSADDIVQVRLAATDLSGASITQVNVGDSFQIRGFLKDLRADDGDGDSATDRRGVFAAFTDLLYNYKTAAVAPPTVNSPLAFDVTFDADYRNGIRGDASVPGVVDGLGSFQSGDSPGPLGALEQPWFVLKFTATAAGNFTFQADPAHELNDPTPTYDTLTYEPSAPVATRFLRLLGGAITVVGAGGEGEFTNAANALDVNDDGYVSAIDALLVINDMNSNGARPLTPGAEGEGGTPHGFIDVNGDNHVSAIDALLVINYLNQGSVGEGELAPIEPFDTLDASTFEFVAFDSGEMLEEPIDFDPTADANIYTMVDLSMLGEESAIEEDSIDAVFDKLDGELDSLDGNDDPRVIYYNMRGDVEQRNPEALRRRREGSLDLYDELALNFLSRRS